MLGADLRITRVDRLDTRLRQLVDNLSAGLPFAGAYGDWLWIVQEARLPDFHLSFLVFESGERAVGVAAFYTVRVDASAYLPDRVGHALRTLRRFHLGSFRPQIGLLSVPFSTGPGIITPADTADADKATLYTRAAAMLMQERLPALMIRSQPSEVVAGALQGMNFINVGLPDTVLDLDYRSFDEYVSRHDKKMRHKIRTETEIFARAGGRVDVLSDPEPHLPALYALYRNTLLRHTEKGEGVPPAEATEAFFRMCLLEKPERFRAIVARLGERPVAFFLIIHVGDHLFVRHSGQDYGPSRETKAYFNLWYGTIRHAIESSCRRMHMGTTTYFVKIQLGARLQPVHNHFRFRLQPLGQLLGRINRHRHGGAQVGVLPEKILPGS
jgi:predicted N-acyltransferase